MSRHHPVQAAKLSCPIFFALFCEQFLGTERRLSIELWQRLYPDATLLFQLARIEDTGRRPDTIQRFGELLPPRQLLEACERLAPSKKGKPRRRDILVLEEAILQRTGPDGQWA